MRFNFFSLSLPPLLLAGCTATSMAPPPAPALSLHAEVFGDTGRRTAQTLVVVLNGDGAPSMRADHYAFARSVAERVPHSVAVALLRPGYGDAEGHRSPGDRGTDTGDNYTSDRIGAVGDAIAALRRRYPAAHTIVVGESGGAAIAANLAGIRPGLFDGLVLVGCPCALPEWRRFMKKKAPAAAWEKPVASLDPLKTAGGINPSLHAAIIVGADDAVTPIRFSRGYAEALTLRGIATDYRILPARGHQILNDPDVLSATTDMAAGLNGKS